MQIVIELDEEEYKDYLIRAKDIPLPHLFGAVYHAIELPKGHGRLIDADNLMEYCLNQKSKTVDCNDIARFGTIIPADKEAENE